ncbi:hypothetical protein UA70_17805 [Raoultella planticola]|nr:hypothetical protein UA70_17805 [Raoultella planticola]
MHDSVPGKISLLRAISVADDGEQGEGVGFLHRGDAGQIISQGGRRRVGEEIQQRQGGKFVTL